MPMARHLVFITALGPALWLIHDFFTDNMGANPIEHIVRFTGDWALRLLIATLTVTPLKIILAKPKIGSVRRMLGLFTYFYATLHLLSYVVLDQFFHWPAIWDDITKRPYITVGFGTFIILNILAVTSTSRWKKRLQKGWRRLHRLVYAAAILGVLHYFMMIRADWHLPAWHGGALFMLLGFRV